MTAIVGVGLVALVAWVLFSMASANDAVQRLAIIFGAGAGVIVLGLAVYAALWPLGNRRDPTSH
jgi:hypothetical protein